MTESIQFCNTPLLRIAYLAAGPVNGRPVLLLHGWPDDPSTCDRIAPALHAAGWRTYTPWLRGFGPTTFLSPQTARSGEMAALAQDALDFADALGIGRFAVVGHDWGARIASVLASARPERLSHCAMLSVAWQPGPLPTPALPQQQAYWYQWFMSTQRGDDFVRQHGKAFARTMWDTWSPPGWFTDAQFQSVARSFENPDWAAVTVHSYRVRWQQAEPDPRYAQLARAQIEAQTIAVPTLMLQGGDDRVALPEASEGKERFHSAGYRRCVLDGIGHFPTREAPAQVAALLVEFLGRGDSD